MNDTPYRPELSGEPTDISTYDDIWVGFPIWWGVAPHIVNSFLEAYDFTEKMIHPFATSGGSGYGHSNDSLQQFAPGAKLESGKMIS